MTLDQLQYFYAAAQLENFTRAAESVHISQPSLCSAIRKLERELGVTLFQPNRKGAILTDAGRLFLQDTQTILEQLDLASTHMRQIAQKDRAQIRIAYTSSLAEKYIPDLLKDFLNSEGQGCGIYADEMPSDQIAQGIREGRFDFGFGSQIPADPELELIPILWQRLCLILPRSWDPEAFEDREAMENAPMVCYRKDYPMYRQVTNLLDGLELRPHFIHYSYSENAIARLVERGLGMSIVAETEGLSYRDVTVCHPEWLTGGRYIYLIRHRTRMVTGAAAMLQVRALAGRDDSLNL